MVSHFIPYDQPKNGRKAFALCGAYVHYDRDHANEPSCPDCQRLKAERDAFDLTSLDDAPTVQS